MVNKGWQGIDLDKTLALHDGTWHGANYIGEPIQPMVDFVKGLLKEGENVKIFTARVSDVNFPVMGKFAIEKWCLRVLGKKLDITNVKDGYCRKIFDDKAYHVVPNQGVIIGLDSDDE